MEVAEWIKWMQKKRKLYSLAGMTRGKLPRGPSSGRFGLRAGGGLHKRGNSFVYFLTCLGTSFAGRARAYHFGRVRGQD
jgi:hypothetical protein